MSRVVALCKGGPLDGNAFSVEEGQPLDSRAELVGALYVPAGDTELPDEIRDLFPWDDHDRAVTYVVQDG